MDQRQIGEKLSQQTRTYDRCRHLESTTHKHTFFNRKHKNSIGSQREREGRSRESSEGERERKKINKRQKPHCLPTSGKACTAHYVSHHVVLTNTHAPMRHKRAIHIFFNNSLFSASLKRNHKGRAKKNSTALSPGSDYFFIDRSRDWSLVLIESMTQGLQTGLLFFLQYEPKFTR